jgi:hypothetical protein
VLKGGLVLRFHELRTRGFGRWANVLVLAFEPFERQREQERRTVIVRPMTVSEAFSRCAADTRSPPSFEWAVGWYPPFGEGPIRDAIVQAVAADWAPFNVIVTGCRSRNTARCLRT